MSLQVPLACCLGCATNTNGEDRFDALGNNVENLSTCNAGTQHVIAGVIEVLGAVVSVLAPCNCDVLLLCVAGGHAYDQKYASDLLLVVMQLRARARMHAFSTHYT